MREASAEENGEQGELEEEESEEYGEADIDSGIVEENFLMPEVRKYSSRVLAMDEGNLEIDDEPTLFY